MVSTPNSPDGLFEAIEKEPEETCLYKRLFLDYTYGLDRIYSRELKSLETLCGTVLLQKGLLYQKS